MKAKLCLLILLGLTGAQAAESSHYLRDILIQNADQPALISVPLDNAVYRSSQRNFADLRILDNQGTEIPYLLQKIAGRKTQVRRIPLHSDAASLQTQGTDGIVITLQTDKDAASVDGLSIATAQKNFEYVVQVQGSEDGGDWLPLVENASIYDYSRYMAVGNKDIKLPNNPYKLFRIVVAQAINTREAELMQITRTLRGDEELQRDEKTDVRHEPLHIEHIDLWHEQIDSVADAERVFEYPVTSFSLSQDNEHQMSVIDISTGNQPLTRFSFDIAAPVFERRAEVQIEVKRGIETYQQTIASGTLSALHFKDIDYDNAQLSFSEQRQANFRVLIYNQDNPPLQINAVTGVGPGYELLFLSQPGIGYSLRYGTEQAVSPSYDIASIRELQRKGYTSSQASLGPEAKVMTATKSLGLAELVNSNWFLGAVISIMVLVLAWSLYRVVKRMAEQGD